MGNSNKLSGIHYEMMRRCYNENSIAYSSFGGKGIKVCEEWHDKEKFKKWAKDNGWKEGLRLERIDTEKDYMPSNCLFGIKSKKKEDSKRQITKRKREIKEAITKECDVPDDFIKTRLYRIYRSMITRCYNPNHKYFYNYGGRGIEVCEQWKQKHGFMFFYRWSMDNGYNETLTLDRIDNNKGYSPDNCRWTTQYIQNLNKRSVTVVVYNNEIISLTAYAKILGIKYEDAKRVIKSLPSINGVYVAPPKS